MKKKVYTILDFETDGLNVNTLSPIQFGALAVDPNKLEIIPNSEFYSWSRPDDIEDPNYYNNHKATVDFHLKNYNITLEAFLTKLKESPPEKTVFQNFDNYLSRYHTKHTSQTIFSAPTLVTFNGFAFDYPILDKLCKKYNRVDKDGNQNLYFTRDCIDILKIVGLWFTPLDDISSLSMDSIRDYMGLSKAGSHDSLVDVRQEAQILIKFLRLHEQLAKKISFKGAFSKETANV